jgi:hypothetical protein
VFGANKMFFVVFVFFCAYPSCGRRFLVRGRARENSRSRSDWAIMGEVLGVILRVPSDFSLETFFFLVFLFSRLVLTVGTRFSCSLSLAG